MTALGQGSGTDDWPDAIRRHAFGIGVATYKEGWDNLPHVPGDVAAILDVLAAFDYRPAQSYPRGLIDPPTPARIRTELRDWAKTEDLEDDMLVVYHAGHGVNEDNQHFLVCNETERDLDVAPETALLTSRLVELLGNSGARRLLVILDACYAGDGAAESLALEARNQIVAAASASPERRRHWKSLEVLAAARCGEAAEDGVFAEVLTSVLRNSVINRHRLAGNRAPYIRLDQVVREVNRILEAEESRSVSTTRRCMAMESAFCLTRITWRICQRNSISPNSRRLLVERTGCVWSSGPVTSAPALGVCIPPVRLDTTSPAVPPS